MKKMTGARTYCCVPGCRSTTLKNPGVTFSPFPTNEDLKKQWINIINLNAPESLNAYKRRSWSKNLTKKPLGAKHHLVCGYHFNPTGKRNKVDKIPIIFDGKRVDGLDESSTRIPYPEVYIQSSNPVLSGEVAIQSTNSLNSKGHDYYNHYVPQTGVCREVIALRSEIYQLNEKIGKLTTQVEFQCQIILDLKKEKRQLKQEHQFRLQSIAMDKKKLEFYTGFKSKEEFDVFYQSLEPDVDNLRIYNTANKHARKTSLNSSGRPSTLDFKNQLFLFLCRIKAGLLEEDLAYRFGVSLSLVSNIWKTWLEFLYEKLPRIMSWPTKEILDSSIPKSFLTGSSTIITNKLADNIVRHKSTNSQNSANSSFKQPLPIKKAKKNPKLEETITKSPPRVDLSPGIFSEDETTPQCDYDRNNPQTSNYFIWQPYNSYNYASFYQPNTQEPPLECNDSSILQNSGITSQQNEITASQLHFDQGPTSELSDKGSTSQTINKNDEENRDNSQSSDSTSSEINSNVNVEKFGGVVNRYKIFKYIFPSSMYSTLSRAWRVSAYLENLTHAAKPIRKDLVEKREAKERLKLGLERTEVEKEPEVTVVL